MNGLFRLRFEARLQKISDSLTKKGGVKQVDKVHEHTWRIKQKCTERHLFSSHFAGSQNGGLFMAVPHTMRMIEATFKILKNDLDLR